LGSAAVDTGSCHFAYPAAVGRFGLNLGIRQLHYLAFDSGSEAEKLFMSKEVPPAQDLIRGKCLCGGFQFEILGPIGEVRLCHCDLCRRANGTAFSANARIPLERYRVIAGEDLISEYESSPGARRCFCSRCGSPVFARVAKDRHHIRIRLGALDREADAQITAHVDRFEGALGSSNLGHSVL
jgi:hypothetical protein